LTQRSNNTNYNNNGGGTYGTEVINDMREDARVPRRLKSPRRNSTTTRDSHRQYYNNSTLTNQGAYKHTMSSMTPIESSYKPQTHVNKRAKYPKDLNSKVNQFLTTSQNSVNLNLNRHRHQVNAIAQFGQKFVPQLDGFTVNTFLNY
jgi:hypothetical protein